jgi:pre-rRNA-processing protein TSR3
MYRVYLDRYQACKNAAEISASQEALQRELEEEHAKARQDKGANMRFSSSFTIMIFVIDNDDGDLLVANPNHVVHPDEDEDDEDEDEMDTA